MESALPFYIRIIIGIIGIILLIGVTFFGSVGYISVSDAQNMYNDLNRTIQGINGPLDIFKNNFLLSTLMIIPLIGIFLAMVIAYNTGQAFAAISIVKYGSNLGGRLFLLTMFFPHFWFEYISYGFAAVQSLIFVYSIVKALKTRKYGIVLTELFITIIIIGIVAAFLLIGAIIEYNLIT
ncbi:MAG: stage II sporulation protein M [Thermoprotei archaeon]